MRLILDTGLFFRPIALREARKSGRPVVLPAIVLAERGRQLALLGRPFHEVATFAAESGIIIEPFDSPQAARLSERAPAKEMWDRHARDAMIAAHVREGDILWTTNPRDFLKLGLRPEQVRGV